LANVLKVTKFEIVELNMPVIHITPFIKVTRATTLVLLFQRLNYPGIFVLIPQRRDYLTVMTKQKLFSFDGNDERVC
jgi:hypothetical protein